MYQSCPKYAPVEISRDTQARKQCLQKSWRRILTMYDRVYSARFKKDLRRAAKRGKDLSLIEDVIDRLANGEILPPEYYDHPLKGKYSGYRECHMEDDWLLIYKIDKGYLILLLSRTVTHIDLFE
jgi:mRNA interferase YafQ